jgi:hypothetical protein
MNTSDLLGISSIVLHHPITSNAPIDLKTGVLHFSEINKYLRPLYGLTLVPRSTVDEKIEKLFLPHLTNWNLVPVLNGSLP